MDLARESAGDDVDAYTGKELGLLSLVHTADTLQSLLRLKFVLDTSLRVDIRHVTTSASAHKVISDATDVNSAPGILFPRLADTRDNEVRAEVQHRDGCFQMGVDIVDRLFREGEDWEVVSECRLLG